MTDGHRRVVWFSCGAASAVAAKLTVEAYGDGCEVVYCNTLSAEHPDNARFFADVERWIERPITVIRSAKFASVDDVFERRRYMAGPNGAICTTQMKKIPRLEWQQPDDVHVFGYTADERKRADDFEKHNPEIAVEHILIDEWVTKAECLARVRAAGIVLPAMYALGFEHNNCLGCVKSQSPGYWNLTRRLFPDVFEKRIRQSRAIGCRLVKIRLPGDPPSDDPPRHFLDELPEGADAPQDDIECGPACQMPLPFMDALVARGALMVLDAEIAASKDGDE